LSVDALSYSNFFPGCFYIEAGSFVLNNSIFTNSSSFNNILVYLSTAIYATESMNLGFYIEKTEFSNLNSLDNDGGGVKLLCV